MADTRRRDKFDRQKKHFKGHNPTRSHLNPLVEVWNETIQYFEENPRLILESEIYDISELTEPEVKLESDGPIIEIMDIDTLVLARRYVEEGLNVLVLNMASDKKPGGGVANGKLAQEEEIFRRSNAHLTHPIEWYPLAIEDIIHSPSVSIVRDTADNDYRFLSEVNIGMITCAALRKPKLISTDTYTDEDYQVMSMKIRAIFIIAIINNYDSLVLGALGCGAFNNPPIQVAKIFKQNINIYGHHFKKIGFGIKVIKPKDSENLSIFRDIII